MDIRSASFAIALALACGAAAAATADDAARSGAASRPSSAAVAAAAAAVRTISFSGQSWSVKSSAGALWGPGPNRFSDSTDNVWVDAEGRLHLKISYRDGAWHCAEVVSQATFGHGSYRFTLDTPVDALDAQAVLGLFTWHDDAAFDHREIDIEFARWGNPLDATNAQYVVQPYDARGNLQRWTLAPGYAATTHEFRWTPRSVAFRSSSAGNTLAQWSYAKRSGIPRPGGENARINLWLFQGLPPHGGQPIEVIVSRFEFVP
jgi:hypothetical protein